VEFDLVEEVKSELDKPIVRGSILLKKMMGTTMKREQYATVLSSSVVPVSYATAQAAQALISWNPTGLTSFTDFALLFSQYKVSKVEVVVWFPEQNISACTSSDVFIVGADPGLALSGSNTAPEVSDLSHSEHWNTSVTTKLASRFSANAQEVPLATDKQGFIDTTSSWSGQTVCLAESAASSTSVAYQYQVRYHVTFRNRF
jgi:hypothetical protein